MNILEAKLQSSRHHQAIVIPHVIRGGGLGTAAGECVIPERDLSPKAPRCAEPEGHPRAGVPEPIIDAPVPEAAKAGGSLESPREAGGREPHDRADLDRLGGFARTPGSNDQIASHPDELPRTRGSGGRETAQFWSPQLGPAYQRVMVADRIATEYSQGRACAGLGFQSPRDPGQKGKEKHGD